MLLPMLARQLHARADAAAVHCAAVCVIAQIDWKLLQSGSWEGTPYKLYEGSFK